LKLVLEPGSAFNHFLNFSDWLWQTTGKTHEFAYEKLLDLLCEHLVVVRAVNADVVTAALLADYQASGARGKPQCLASHLGLDKSALTLAGAKPRANNRSDRQGRHLAQQSSQHVFKDAIQKAAAAA
jgi:hypothetical protein